MPNKMALAILYHDVSGPTLQLLGSMRRALTFLRPLRRHQCSTGAERKHQSHILPFATSTTRLDREPNVVPTDGTAGVDYQ